MKISTAHFGEVEIDEKSLLHFEEGIPGFENLKKFVVLKDANSTTPFSWLQSIESEHTALPVTNPFDVKNDYVLDIDDSTKHSLNLMQEHDVAIFAVTTVPGKISRMSVNLKSPIIINTSNNKARQMIMHDTRYDTKHYILEEIVSTGYNTHKLAAETK